MREQAGQVLIGPGPSRAGNGSFERSPGAAGLSGVLSSRQRVKGARSQSICRRSRTARAAASRPEGGKRDHPALELQAAAKLAIAGQEHPALRPGDADDVAIVEATTRDRGVVACRPQPAA
jgi:hypothetical protein